MCTIFSGKLFSEIHRKNLMKETSGDKTLICARKKVVACFRMNSENNYTKPLSIHSFHT